MGVRAEKTVAGVDGAKGEWVVAIFDGTVVEWSVAADVDAVLETTARRSVVAVDMPLSMPEESYRISELAAKAFLGPARSSIFHTPVSEVLDAEDYREACDISRRITGKAISKQTWHLLPSVRAWRAAEFDPDRVVEVHPECSFRAMAPTTAFASKKTGRGAGQRMAALSTWIDPHNLAVGLAELPPGPALDDALDAAAAAWSAWRYSQGKHRTFGSTNGPDRIVY
ncbi:DUF429 domain-containing protein [Rhodococcus sp. H29-C3]|uniref:DUF429 domain-containing protein n=1 Tax=Rhodococcus sp. H29-C3 TaxID=3046307 RepID=UPI0024B98C5D|nr:DUF429 domain-containing protein [Rhodococcus sp. H29-C3]MDJ0360716.1 DUF429 domain-containing protein [Rhodococcus sp. H29-C3]